MKTAVVALVCLFAANVFAQDFSSVPTQYPENWDLAMASMACKADLPSDSVVSSVKTDKGIVLTVTANGEVVAKAIVSNGSIFSKKECLALNLN